MASVDHKVKQALDEARMLALVTAVLIGFDYRASFEPLFQQLPPTAQYLKVAGLSLELVTLALLGLCATYHLVVARGESSRDLQHFCSRAIELALFPFAVALGIEVYVGVGRHLGSGVGLVASVGAVLVALWCWYGLGLWACYQRAASASRRGLSPRLARPEGEAMSTDTEQRAAHGTSLQMKVEQVLTEARMILPGVQALLGFQLASMLMEGFDKLPEPSKYVHLASLGCIAVAAILLMTPPAYHRIVEDGEDTGPFHRFASRMVLAAMVPLALGIAGDLYVVVAKVADSLPLAVAAAALALALFYGLWFGFTLYRRRQRREEAFRRLLTHSPEPESSAAPARTHRSA